MLRRISTPAGGVVLLCAVLAASATAATPTPDPPPAAVAPEPPPVTRRQPAPVRSAPEAVAPAPAVGRAEPVVRAQPVQTPAAKPKPIAKRKPVAKPKPKVVARPTAERTVAPVPHDRERLPLVALVTADELDRGLLTVAGFLLLLIALCGGTVAWFGRRALTESVS